jgi:hypothetical protein
MKCKCGCGKETNIATESCPKRGRNKRGMPYDYIIGHHLRKKEKYKINPNTECWIWQLYINDDGYGVMWYKEKDKAERAHVVFYIRSKGPIPKGKVLHHTCENPTCVNPEHLEPLTRTEHKRKHGILNENSVRKIREMKKSGLSSRKIATIVNASRSTVQNVLKKRTWKGVR